jgi:prepilin-type processing-associated H-X9-DG protein
MRTRRATTVGLTLAELVVIVFVLGAIASMVLPAILRAHAENRRMRCRNNLNQLAKGMATYINEHVGPDFLPCPLGRGRTPGDYNGAEWLAALYWTGVVPDPSVFICPSSGDMNRNGLDLGTRVAASTFGSQTVSYAAMHYGSRPKGTESSAPGFIDAFDVHPFAPMASDDTQGDINHGTLTNGGMSVLFFDAHVEFKTHTELDLKRAVGQEGGLLEELRN